LESFEKSKEKVVTRIETCKQSLLRKCKSQDESEPTIISMVELKLIRYATRSTPPAWQSYCFIQTLSCEVIWPSKIWNRKIHGWFRSHFW